MAEVRYSIGQVAEELGVAVITLRRLERRGVIPPALRDWNQRRYYTADGIEAIRQRLFAESHSA